MQPGHRPEDFQSILSRFQNWAEKHPADGSGNGHATAPVPEEEIREIPYEEAIRQLRTRQTAARAPRRPANPKTKDALANPSSPATHPRSPASFTPPLPSGPADLSSWIASLPVIPATEPFTDLELADSKVAPVPDVYAEPPAESLQQPPLPRQAPRARIRKSSPARRSIDVTTPKPEVQTPSRATALPNLPARAFVDLVPAALAPRHRPARNSSSRLTKKKPASGEQPPCHATAPALPPSIPKPATPSLTSRPTARSASARISSELIRNPSMIAPRLSAPITASPVAPARRVAAPAAAPSTSRKSRHAPFHQVLAGTVQQPKALLAPKKKLEPDRTRRITTRFTPAEERRIERQAAALGITVSAYLRRCALCAVAAQNPAGAPAPENVKRTRRKTQASSALQSATYTSPPPSLFAGWFALLRNRFLGPPIRFSEEA